MFMNQWISQVVTSTGKLLYVPLFNPNNYLLQASLTIFGAVGGPLLGIFTLGMLTESANQAGAVTGVLSSLAFTLWIAFGQPRPRVTTLPTSTLGCDTSSIIKDIFNATIPVTELLVSTKYVILYFLVAPKSFKFKT